MLTGRQSRPTSRLDRRTGFTLIELVVAMAIFSIVLFSAMLALNMTFSVGLRNRRRSEAQEDISAAMEQITRQLRQAKPDDLICPSKSSSTSIEFPGDSGFILQFKQLLADKSQRTVAYGYDVPAEVVPRVGENPNYEVTVLWEAVGGTGVSPQPLTGQNVTSFTAERPSWSNNVVIITMQSEQRDASGTKVSPLTVMTMVTLRQ